MDALKGAVENLDDLPEAVRGFYKEDDGRYVLNAEGVVEKARLDEFRDNNIKLVRQNEDLAKRLKAFESFDPDEYKALKEAASKREDEEAAKRGEFDKLLAKKEEQYRKLVEEQEGRAKALEAQVLGLVRDQEARKALERAGANVNLLLPHVLSRVDVVEEDGQRKAVVLNEEGVPRLNDEGQHMTITDLVSEMAESDEYRAAFPASVANGGGAAGTSAGRASSSNGLAFETDWQKVEFIEKHGLQAFQDRIGIRRPT